MSVKEQFQYNLWAVTSDYNEVLPYLNNDNYNVMNTYHANGLFDSYYIHLK
jgi:hypothetical protein